MDVSTVIALFALIISGLSFGFTAYATLRNAPGIKAKSRFSPPESNNEEQPPDAPLLEIIVANHGRRPRKLEYMYIKYKDGQSRYFDNIVWGSDEHGHWLIDANDVYREALSPENDSILMSDKHGQAVDIFFMDTLENEYRVKYAKKNINAYLKAANEYPY